MFISSTTCVQQPLWAIKAQFSIRPNWASCSYSLFSVYFYLTSAASIGAAPFFKQPKSPLERRKNQPVHTNKLIFCFLVVFRTLGADTEVKLLHTVNLFTDVLERTNRAVSGQTFKNVGECSGNGGCFLCDILHCGIIE